MTTYYMTPLGSVFRNEHMPEGDVPNGWQPVAVVPYEDREQVERLVSAIERSTGGKAGQRAVDDMQAALREFANPTPPKPEPTGLGAVVETPGGRYVRSDVETCNPWRGPNGVPFEWDDLDGPVHVLSWGWSE